MKFRLTLTVVLVLYQLLVLAQWTNKSFVFESKTRQYRVYVPTCYNASNPAALVITLHGLGDNMTNFSTIGMNLIADTANFIVVVPQAWTDAIAGTAWNSGAGTSGYFPNSTVNDKGFINALADTVVSNYSINTERLYLCGFSMGGFMTERMACESNGKFAAFASVAGTIGVGLTSCNPGRAIPLAHFHGTSDGTVNYYTNSYGINTDSLIHFWTLNNQCNPQPGYEQFPDIASDGFTVDHYSYTGGNNNADVELFKVNGADHQWLFLPDNDISYSIEIWKFFSRYPQTLHVKNVSSTSGIQVYPNPVHNELFLYGDKLNTCIVAEVCDNAGRVVCSFPFKNNTGIDVHSLQPGMYFLRLCSNNEINYFKFIKE